jgi:hypothetical protein
MELSEGNALNPSVADKVIHFLAVINLHPRYQSRNEGIRNAKFLLPRCEILPLPLSSGKNITVIAPIRQKYLPKKSILKSRKFINDEIQQSSQV